MATTLINPAGSEWTRGFFMDTHVTWCNKCLAVLFKSSTRSMVCDSRHALMARWLWYNLAHLSVLIQLHFVQTTCTRGCGVGHWPYLHGPWQRHCGVVCPQHRIQFQIWIKYWLDTLIIKILILCKTEINSNWGELTDMSAKLYSLVPLTCTY